MTSRSPPAARGRGGQRVAQGILVDTERLRSQSEVGLSARCAQCPHERAKGGVEGLVFSQEANGTRSMDYTYQGEAYYIRCASTDTPDCYAFETRTETHGGEIMTGDYCR